MQQTPRSLNNNAPGSMEKGAFLEARTAAAVNPAVEVPRPATYVERAATLAEAFNNCDFETPGSPISSKLMLGRMLISRVVGADPPTNAQRHANLGL